MGRGHDENSTRVRRVASGPWVSFVALAGVFVGCTPGATSRDDAGPPSIDAAADASVPRRCTTDGECDDGVFCDGAERCTDGRCVEASTASCGPGARCDEAGRRCVTSCAEPDLDGDGRRAVRCGGDDCDDADPNRFPGNAEVCDATSHDEDCDPSTYGVRDTDADGSVDARCCNEDAGGARICGADCDDMRAGANPTAPEVCDRVDDDCDGAIDEGVMRLVYADLDGDGFGAGPPTESCDVGPRQVEGNATDCDDTAPSTHPGATEICDGVDDDCNGLTDDVFGLGTACDVGAGTCARRGVLACVGPMLACTGDTGTPTVETCNRVDDDCDRLVDEGLTVPNCHPDLDADGFGVGVGTSQCLDGSRPGLGYCPAGFTNNALDCDDARYDVRPAAREDCNGRDDDCDGAIDDGATLPFYPDLDRDGHGAGAPIQACAAAGIYVASSDDCDDGDGAVHPGAPERCDGVIDDDCDGAIDDGCACTTGATQACGTSVGICTVGSQTCTGGLWGACSGTPARPEICDGLDQDCDGVADDGVYLNFFPDTDGDGFGQGVAVSGCTPPAGYVRNTSDCNDALGTVHPGALELCNGTDDDCDSTVDEGCACEPGTVQSCGSAVGACTFGTQLCTSARVFTTCTGVAPSVESCNGLDDDCNALVDDVPPSATTLAASCGRLVPAFSPDVTSYVVEAGLDATTCAIAAASACPGAQSITVDGIPLASGSTTAPRALALGTNRASIVIAAPGGRTRTYSIAVRRQWRLSEYVKASNTGRDDAFGTAVALSGDGLRLAVGAPWEASAAVGVGGAQTDNSASGAGAVYVFVWNGSAWTQEAYLKASNTDAGDHFGGSLAFSSDGTRLAVGAWGEASAASGVGADPTNDAAPLAGAVYVFARTGSAWTQEAYVKASNADAGDRFGEAVALSGDGAVLAVGASYESSNARGIDGDGTNDLSYASGATYVFTRAGSAWSEEAYVKAADANGNDRFGTSVALSRDGLWLAVGAPFDDAGAPVDAGTVYVFARGATGWSQRGAVRPSPVRSGGLFGRSVSLSSDGSRLASGAPGVDANVGGTILTAAGAAYVMRRTATGWTEEAALANPASGASDWMGQAISLSADGTRLAVGIPQEDSGAIGVDVVVATDDLAGNAGAVVVYSVDPAGAWGLLEYVKATNTGSGDRFGSAVCMSADGTRFAVGAPDEDSTATGIGGSGTMDSSIVFDAGAAYLYTTAGLL